MAVLVCAKYQAFTGVVLGHDGLRPLSSFLACWPWWAATDISFGERRLDGCAIFVFRQQTWKDPRSARSSNAFFNKSWVPGNGTVRAIEQHDSQSVSLNAASIFKSLPQSRRWPEIARVLNRPKSEG
jgi:hypothetical protein